jgi:uncharacterized membrane protein
MEDEEESSNSEDEPPSLWFILLLIAIPLLIFYPFKTLLGIFLTYCTYVGYSEDKKRAAYRRNRRKK